MDNPDLENVPPDLVGNFLENQKVDSVAIDFDSECSVASPSSKSIRKRNPKRISKRKGSIIGKKEIAAVVDLVESDLANKTDRYDVFIGSEKKMEVEATKSSSEVSNDSRSESNANLIKSMGVAGVNGMNVKSDNVDLNSSFVNECVGIVGNYMTNSDQYMKKVIQLYENRAASLSQANSPNPVVSGTDKKIVEESGSVSDKQHIVSNGMIGSKSGAISVDINNPVDLVTGQRPKSGLEMANENNSEILSRIGIGNPGNMGSSGSGFNGSGVHHFTFGNGSGVASLSENIGGSGNDVGTHLSSVKGIQSSGKVPDVVMAENVEKDSSVKAVTENKKVENVWNSKGVTLADKIKGCGEEEQAC
ncbi:hypothetical protein L6452_21404 [Arctium lappa]|uniref:Uncharacterized protein n=1 Tax=Arctium lappa TaxID=4217 RepID=A0ACB9BE04_ARCLA|nr:hypothetical protein L6452_21404 [Arctium lappa]